MEKKKMLIIGGVVIAIIVLGIIIAIVMSNQSKEANNGNYKELYSESIEKLNEMNKNSDFIGSCVVGVWQEAGPDKASQSLLVMLTATKEEDLKGLDGYYIGKAFKLSNDYSSDRSSILKYCKEYQSAYSSISSSKEEIKNNIQQLKNKYSNEHKSEIDDIVAYYSKSNSYAESVMSPSGSLLSFNNSLSTLKNDVKNAKEQAELNN